MGTIIEKWKAECDAILELNKTADFETVWARIERLTRAVMTYYETPNVIRNLVDKTQHNQRGKNGKES